MTDEERNDRKLKVQEALAAASLGGRTVSEDELEAAEEYVNGEISLKELEERAAILTYDGVFNQE